MSHLEELQSENAKLKSAARDDAAEISRLLDINKQLQNQLIAAAAKEREVDEKLNEFEHRITVMRDQLNRLTIMEGTVDA